MFPKVSIIILHWKNVNDTLTCLRSLKKCDYKNFDVYLVLNGATREDKITLRNLFDQWDKIIFIENDDNIGFAEGNNTAIRQALKTNSDFILTLNNDTEVEPDFINQAVVKAQEGYDMVQCLMYDYKNRGQIDKAGIKLTLSGLTFDIKKLSDPAPIFCPSAGAALYSAKLLNSCALERQKSTGFQSSIVKDYFDKDYFAYAEDFDLGFRALLKGFKTALAHKSIVYHKGSASTSTMSDFACYHTYRNLIFTYLKCFPIIWIIFLTPLIKIGAGAVFFKSLTRKQGKVITNAWLDAWRYRKKMLYKRKIIQTGVTAKPFTLFKSVSKNLFK